MVVLVTGNMGAQTESTAQAEPPQLTNSERCIICYEAHTVTKSETGVPFELKNLKDVFVRCFGIQFLPHYADFGRVHMCTRCNEEYSKVEKLHDAVKCTENSFDAAREKLAFLVVDSIIKSNYICNYKYCNAFDSIRFLVFKAWSTKFKKQGQSKKGNNNNNSDGNNSVNLDENSQSEITATEDTAAGLVKNSTDESKSPPDKTITEEDEKIPPPLSKIILQQNKSVQKKASTEPKTTRTSEKAGNPDQPPVQEAKVTEGKAQSPSHQLVTSSVDPECEKNSEGPPVLVKQVEDRGEENQSASISSTNITKESSKSTQGEKKADSKTTSEPSPASANAKAKPAEVEEEDLVRKSSIPSLPAEKKQADAPPPLRASIPKPGQPTYILSPDGKKLMSNTGGVLQNTKLIFVKKDPLTGKMIQVPRPNLGSVKGKLNGKDVIVRTAPSSANNLAQIRPLGVTSADSVSTIITMIPRSKVSTSSISVTVSPASTDSPPVPKIVSVQSMQNRPQNKPVVPASSPPKLQPAVKQKNDPAPKQKNEPAVKQKTEPAVKQKTEPAVKQKTEPATKQKSEPAVKQKNEPDDPKSIEDNKGPQSKQQPQQQPTLTEESPEQRSSRSGRRIKRPFESSDWASGHEMNKLLSHSIKVGRHQLHSPSKRQKSDVVKASSTIITSELLDTSDQPEEEEAIQE